jgi:hypothetical protein
VLVSSPRERGGAAPEGAGLPPEIDTTKPHSARMYDYYLGGKDNFAADRAAAEQAIAAWPSIRVAARENRAFVGRAVRYLTAEAGISQFLDIGSGLPGTGNVHDVAQSVIRSARVVYVDNDPIVLAHARALLVSTPEGKCAYIQADLREPEKLLADPVVRETLDFGRPIALILAAVLPFVPDEAGPVRIVKTLVDALPPGSYVVASHGGTDYVPEHVRQGLGRAYSKGATHATSRDAREFADLVFSGLELVPPGMIVASEWRPEANAYLPPRSSVGSSAAVGRKS